jgi:hypothetical protein
MEGDGVIERDTRVQRQVEHGRAAAGDEEEDQRVFAGFLEHRERGPGCGKRLFVGQRMAAFKVAKTPVALFGELAGAADAAHSLAALDAIEQNLEHGRGGLAQRDDKDALAARDVDGLRSNAFGQKAVESVALDANAAVEGRCNAACLDGAGEDCSRGGVQ